MCSWHRARLLWNQPQKRVIRFLKIDPECSTAYSDRLQIAAKHDMKHEEYYEIGENKLTLKQFVKKYKHKYFTKEQLETYKLILDTESLKWHCDLDTTKQMKSEPLYTVCFILFTFHIHFIYISYTFHIHFIYIESKSNINNVKSI